MKEKAIHAITLALAIIGCGTIVHYLHDLRGTSDIFNYLIDIVSTVVIFTPVVLQYFSWTELQHHARHDALTGSFNRAAFNKHFERFLQQEQNFQLVMIDLVKFKGINDTYGHRVGDEVLKTVSSRLQSLMQPGQVSARLGGDEFVALIPGKLSDAKYINLIRQIEAPVIVDGISLHVGLSVGVSTYPDDGIDPSILMHQADSAMYFAKKNGFRLFSGTPDYIGETRARHNATV